MPKNPFLLSLLTSALSLVLSGCAQLAPTNAAVTDIIDSNVRNASSTISYVFGQDSINRLSKKQLLALPGSARYGQLNDNPAATLVLAEIEQQNGVTMRQWQAANEAIITHNGRVTRSEGLQQNIRYTANLDADPLGCWLSESPSSCAQQWHSQQDVELADGRVMRLITQSRFKRGGQAQIQTQLRGTLNTNILIETVTANNGQQWQNRYWYTPGTGYVVKTEQQLGINDSPMSGTLTLEEARF